MKTENAISCSFYWTIWGGLILLLGVTWGVAQFNLGLFNVIAAMTISVAKMLLVILYFMHARYSSRLIWLLAGAGFFWLAIMLTLTMTDYLTR